MELNKILSDGRWGDMASLVNANFEKIKLELMKLRFASILTFCKGYFSTEARFLAKFPKGKTGEYAFVGSPWPGTVYEWIDTNWVNTKVAPQLGEGIFMELLKQHIDNKTILWDDKEKYIYSLGGGGSTFTIAVGIDASSVGKCSVEATGDVISVTPSDNGSSYTVVANAGGTVTVKIVPASGYEVGTLTVDNESKGVLDEYTFGQLSTNHTMSVNMVLSEEVPTEFLIRSDLPGMYYSSTQDAFNALKASYPDGLTKDVTLTCIKTAKEKRGNTAWLAYLANWNNRTPYMLTIDGGGKLTYNCKSAGGLSISNVDNIVCRNISFIDVANGVEFPSPDELSAILFRGENSRYARNLYVENCRVTGATTLSGVDRNAYYAVISKKAENVYLVNNHIEQCNCIPIKMVDCSLLSLIKNYIKADYSYGIIGHPALCTISNCEALIAEDNEFTGTTGEYYFFCQNVERVYMRRNKIHGGRGRIIEFLTKNGVQEFTFESNIVYDMLKSPSVAWAKELFAFSKTTTCNMINNTLVMSGEWYEQYITRGGDVTTANIFNNIVIGDNGNPGKYVGGFYFDKVKTLNSGSNIYQMPVKAVESGTAHRSFIVVTNLNNDADSITLSGVVSSSIQSLNTLGYEMNSNLVAPDVMLLDNQYKPKEGFSYYSNEIYTPAIDADYKLKAAADNSRGCYNLAGTFIDESTDATSGFKGVDYSEDKTFSSKLQYFVLADSVLLVNHNTLNRNKFIRLSAIGTQHSELILGRYGLMSVNPVLDANGEYVEDELYTVNIN